MTSVSSAEDEVVAPIVESQQSAGTTPDLRTVTLSDGSEVRVATYRLPDSAVSSTQPIAYIQAGRMLTDQNHLLGQILLTVLLACAGAAVVVGLASWYLAGRSLRPAQKSVGAAAGLRRQRKPRTADPRHPDPCEHRVCPEAVWVRRDEHRPSWR